MKHLLITLLFVLGVAFQPAPKLTPATLQGFVAQGKTVIQINAGWNKANQYKWVPNPTIKYSELSLDEFPELKSKLNVQSVPLLLFYNNGKLTERVEGGMSFKITTPQAQLISTSFN
jgi:hypothetical protein